MKKLNKFFCWFIDDLIEKEWANKPREHTISMDFFPFRNGFYQALNCLDLIEDAENIKIMCHCSSNKNSSISLTEGK